MTRWHDFVWNPGYFWIEQARRKESARLRREFVEALCHCDGFVRWKIFTGRFVAASDPCDRSSFCWQILIDSVFFTYVCFTFQICSSLKFCRIVPMSIVDKSFQQKTSHAHLTKLDILVSLHVTTMLLILSSFDVFCRHVSAFHSRLLNLKHLDFKQTHWTLFLISLVFW